MKTFLFIYFIPVILPAILAVSIFSSCQPSNQEAVVSGNNVCITDPTACNGTGAINGSAYPPNNAYPNNSQLNNYANNQGGYPYGYSNNYAYNFNYYNNRAYLCHCPYGTIPAYNAGHANGGLSCIPSTYLQSSQVSSKVVLSGYLYLSWGHNQWNALPQLYKYNYGSGSNLCYNGVVQSCTVNQPNSCPASYFCRPNRVSGSQNLGLCVASNR